MNRGDLVRFFDKYENKIEFKPSSFVEDSFDSIDSFLDSLVVYPPYLNTDYVPKSVSESEEDLFLKSVQEDPTKMYKKQISWASGSLTGAQVEELTELIGWHMNRYAGTGKTIIVNYPTEEQLKEYEQEVVYYTDLKKGILYFNLFVQELDESNKMNKNYVYTFNLKYDMEGKVVIR